jgi:hypothetical protein
MVVVGSARNDKAVCVYNEDDFFGGIAVSSFMFGGGYVEPEFVSEKYAKHYRSSPFRSKPND